MEIKNLPLLRALSSNIHTGDIVQNSKKAKYRVDSIAPDGITRLVALYGKKEWTFDVRLDRSNMIKCRWLTFKMEVGKIFRRAMTNGNKK